MYLKDSNNFTVSKANQLTTARTINGTSFNGSANITTANWGTARTLTIGSTGKSVNGSGNVSWTLAEMGAAAASHTHSYLPLSGGSLSGSLVVQNPNNGTGAYSISNTRMSGTNEIKASMNVSFHSNNGYDSGMGLTVSRDGTGIAEIIINRNNLYPSVGNNMSIGKPNYKFHEAWVQHVRCWDEGTVISTGETLGSEKGKRGGLWLNTTGFRPLQGDITYTCGQNGYRWNAVWCVNGSNTTSDRELKTNIKSLTDSKERNSENKFYNFVKDDLNFYSWDWKNKSDNEDLTTNIGIIAQELEQSEIGKLIVIPPKEEVTASPKFNEDGSVETIQETITTNYAINDRNMYMSLGIALKEAINKIEGLEVRVKELENN